MILVEDFRNCLSFIGMTKDLDLTKRVELSTDTRTLKKDEIFLAITGDNFNALSFLDKVEKSGCKVVIYTKNLENDKLISKYKDRLTFIETVDTIKFYQEITNILSVKFQKNGGKLIAISGSNGKTTTKEMLYHLLSSVHPETICTQKNNNNHIGVPLTLLQIKHKTKYAIIELGSNHPGEIEVLCNICEPAIGVTTNIGDTHLEFFQNQENVFKEEGYLYNAVAKCDHSERIFFRNSDDKFLNKLSVDSFVINFGQNGDNYKFSIDKEHAIVNNGLHEYKLFNKNITGKHNFHNLCLAFSIAQKIDAANEVKYHEAANSFTPTSNRSEWLEYKGVKVFLDAYNANPSSMKVAIDGFVEKVGFESDYCLIIGDMYELGPNAAEYHKNLARDLLNKKYKNLFYVGQFSKDYNAGSNDLERTFSTTEELKKSFQNLVLDKYKYVFIKGSRSLQLESLIDITLP
jgi:UDP-N-acetylmuramoyl-tripeptide--D-alanyl-D-alanine ligase